MKNAVGSLVLALVFSLVFVAFAVGGEDTKPIKEVTATIDQDGVQRVAVIGGGYYFDPNYIIVKVNVPVELTVTKDPGFVPHDIAMKAPEAGMEFTQDLSDQPKIIAFTPTKVGKYPIFCTKKLLFFESHRHKGMEGTIEVRE